MNKTPSRASTELSRFESFQYPNAHLGHLTEAQQKALGQFKDLCQKEGYWKPADVDGRQHPTHDDATLLRYLRARKFDPSDALVQFKDTEDWRKENHLEQLYDTIDVQEYEDTRRLYPQWTGRRDKRGIPVYLFKVAHLDSKTVSAYEKGVSKSLTVPHNEQKVPTKMLRLFALYENLTRFVMPLCTAMSDRPNRETPVTQSNNIVDISNVGLKQFWNLKTHMQDASQLATAHYPETLDRIFIIGAPTFFPTVWGWIKRWFDPITVSKIFILSNSTMKSTLEKYIDSANIPKKYGGALDFEFGDMPNLDPTIIDNLKWVDPVQQKGSTTIPTGPIKWYEKENEMEAVAVGSVDRQRRKQVIASTTTDIRGMTGIQRMNSIDLSRDANNLGSQRTDTTDGTATQPSEEGDLYYGADLKSPSSSGAATPNAGTEKAPPEPSTNPAPGDLKTNAPIQTEAEANNDIKKASGAATAAAPAPAAVPPATVQPTASGSSGKSGEQPRVGTSETRLEQQNATHAAGKMADRTPAVVDHGHGDRTATMEPATVGQARKEKELPKPEGEQKPGLYEKGMAAAGAVYATGVAVAEKAGVVKSQEELDKEKDEEERKKKEAEEQHKRDIDDPKVNEAKDDKVERFLRSGVGSEPAKVE